MNAKKLSRRLDCVAGLLPRCQCIADVGCDHGLLGLHLLQSDQCQTLIASDISQPSLQKAIRLYRVEGLSDRVKAVLCDGLPDGGQQAAVIAGIGGRLILHILEKDRDVARKMQCLVLQPSDDAARLRFGLSQMGFAILDEIIVHEGRYFSALSVFYDGKLHQLDELACEIGPKNMENCTQTVLGYAKWRKHIWENAIKHPAKTQRGQLNQQTAERLFRALTLWCEENEHACDAFADQRLDGTDSSA